MQYLRDDPAFHHPERLRLVRWANDLLPADTPGVGDALDVVGVDEVCLYADDTRRLAVVRGLGWADSGDTQYYRCLLRPSAG